jgi:hypothetical protein
MKNFINFFFSFDKLFKEKLVVPFFWLALVVMGLAYLAEALDRLSLDPLASIITFIGFFAEVLLVLISIRILSEIIVAIFRINDNVSPDGGKSELADIDPVGEARKAAEQAASRTREMTKTAADKAKSSTSSTKAAEDESKGTAAKAAPAPTAVKATEPSATDALSMKKGSTAKATPAAAKAEPKIDPKTGQPVKRGRGRPKGSTNKTTSTATKKPAPIDPVTGEPIKRGRGRPKGSTNKTKSAAVKAAPKIDPETGKPVKSRRGRPKGSKNKPKAAGADGEVTKSKPGPKPGTKVKRDADGNLLKKDGTPRKKPGPKPQDD